MTVDIILAREIKNSQGRIGEHEEKAFSNTRSRQESHDRKHFIIRFYNRIGLETDLFR